MNMVTNKKSTNSDNFIINVIKQAKPHHNTVHEFSTYATTFALNKKLIIFISMIIMA